MTYRAVIVDDEPLAIEVLKYYLKDETDFIVTETFTNPAKALAYLKNNETDILFLDINMAVLNGLELVKQLTTAPLIVFTTAHKQYLQDGFDFGVLDYLQKPIKKSRFSVTLERARKKLREDKRVSPPIKQIHIKSAQKEFYINSNDILFIKAVKDYCQIYLSNDTRVMALGNLKSFIDKHGLTDSFIRVHRSYIIPADRVKEINSPGVIPLKKYNIPIGRKYRKDVIDSLKNKNEEVI